MNCKLSGSSLLIRVTAKVHSETRVLFHFHSMLYSQCIEITMMKSWNSFKLIILAFAVNFCL